MSETPLWRKGFDTVEGAVGPRLETVTRSSRFAEVTGTAVGVQRGVRRWAEQRSRRLWHLANLPAGSDVTRLREQVAALDLQVRRLTSALEDERDAARRAARAPR